MTALLSWLGPGRKLTRTGRITLADARELVALLDTGDQIDPKIGDRTFRTKSSEELYELTLVVEWAKAARLVRAAKGRLVPVRSRAGLLDRPLELAGRLWEVLGQLGPTICREGWFESLLRYEFGNGLAALTVAVRRDTSVPIEEAANAVWDEISPSFTLDNATDLQRDTVRKANHRDVGATLSALEQLGAVTLTDAEVALTPLGRRLIRGSLDAEPGDPMLRIRVELLEVEPTVWRRLLVPAGLRLDQLHRVLQAAIGWTDSHLHWFTIGDQRWGVPDPDWPELGVRDERVATVRDLATLGSGRFGYTYDFGDDWQHALVVELETRAEAGRTSPTCVDGAGACPPEDCGGAPGYEDLRRVLADPGDPAHGELLSWLGMVATAGFDPAHFDLTRANRTLAAL